MPDKQNSPENGEKLWVVVGDIHDDVDNFDKIPELGEACGIIVTGDLTLNGGPEQAARVIGKLQKHNLPILAQIGNMDEPEVNDWLTEKGINLHTFVRELAPGVAIFGIGASTPTPFHTPSEFPEKTYAHWLARAWDEAKKYPHAVLISHNPPKDTVCDCIPGDLHVGSIALRDFLEQEGPEICFCGHIHEGRGEERLGRTEVINPGTLASGGYAILKLKDGRLSATLGQV